MVKLKQKIKERIFSKGTLVYLISYAHTVLSILSFLIVTTIDYSKFGIKIDLINPNTPVDLIVSIILPIYMIAGMLILIPSQLISHGIISYSSTKMIIVPNLLLFISLPLCVFIIDTSMDLEDFIGALKFSGILTAVSLVASIITAIITGIIKLIVKVIKKIIRSKP